MQRYDFLSTYCLRYPPFWPRKGLCGERNIRSWRKEITTGSRSVAFYTLPPHLLMLKVRMIYTPYYISRQQRLLGNEKVGIRSYKRWKCSEKSLILARKRKVSYVFIVKGRSCSHDENLNKRGLPAQSWKLISHFWGLKAPHFESQFVIVASSFSSFLYLGACYGYFAKRERNKIGKIQSWKIRKQILSLPKIVYRKH